MIGKKSVELVFMIYPLDQILKHIITKSWINMS